MVRGIVRDESPSADLAEVARQVAVSEDGTVYSVTMTARVDVYSSAGEILGSRQLTGPHIGEAMPIRLRTGQVPPTVVSGMTFDESQRLLWVFLVGADRTWPPRAQDPTPEQVRDGHVRVLQRDGRVLKIVGIARFDSMLRPLGGRWAYDLFSTPTGDRRIRVGQMECDVQP